VWWLDALDADGFQAPPIALSLFATALGAVSLVKLWGDLRRGHYRGFDEGSYLYFRHRLFKPRFILPHAFARASYWVQGLGALLLLVGVAPRLALALLLLAFAVQLKVRFKFNTNLLFLFCALLLVSGDLGAPFGLAVMKTGLTTWLLESAQPGPVASQLAVMATVCVVYWATAYRKFNRDFLDGTVVRLFLVRSLKERSTWFRPFSRVLEPWLFPQGDWTRRAWWVVMIGVVTVELMLPFLLLHPTTLLAGVAIGFALHAGFALMEPRRLVHFSLLMTASYILFWDPSLLVEFTSNQCTSSVESTVSGG